MWVPEWAVAPLGWHARQPQRTAGLLHPVCRGLSKEVPCLAAAEGRVRALEAALEACLHLLDLQV